MASTTRLNKYISESGICSRRDADRFIEQGNVFINGRRASVGDQVSVGDTVKVNGQLIEAREAEDIIFIAVNKPVGIVSTTDSAEPDNIVDFVRHSARIFPVGRLDKDSQGLIFLTNQGDWVNKILRAGNDHEKEYLVTVDKPITDAFILGMGQGVPMLGTKTKKCKVVKEAPNVFRITLVQGLNRQIRRMCEHFAYEALKLERVRIMNVSLKGLGVGEWRDLKEVELTELLKLIEHSSSEARVSTAKSRKKKPAQTGERTWYAEKPKQNRGRSAPQNDGGNTRGKSSKSKGSSVKKGDGPRNDSNKSARQAVPKGVKKGPSARKKPRAGAKSRIR